MRAATAGFLLSLPLAALGAIHDVQVGVNGEEVFGPDSLNASVGDQVRFTFGQKNHSVAQSTFDAPCKLKDQGFFSGVQLGSSTTFTLTINDTNAIWIYCSYAKHCEAGMAMVINQVPTGETTLAAYKTAAAKVDASMGGNSVTGGILATNGTSGSSTNSSSSSSGSGSNTSSSSGSSSTGSSSGSGSGSGSSSGGATMTASQSSSATGSGATTSMTGNAAAMGMVPAIGLSGAMAVLAVAGLV